MPNRLRIVSGMNSYFAQIRTDSRQTKREHAAWCRAWDTRSIVKIDGGTFVPAKYLRTLRASDVRSGAQERRENALGFVLAHGGV